MSRRLWYVYSIALIVMGIVLLLLTGRAGIILIAGGVIGLVLNARRLRR